MKLMSHRSRHCGHVGDLWRFQWEQKLFGTFLHWKSWRTRRVHTYLSTEPSNRGDKHVRTMWPISLHPNNTILCKWRTEYSFSISLLYRDFARVSNSFSTDSFATHRNVRTRLCTSTKCVDNANYFRLRLTVHLQFVSLPAINSACALEKQNIHCVRFHHTHK